MIRKRINTNLITGFLGAGKTSLIVSLLAIKPKDETWAVLVNEFGEVGIDASLITGSNSSEQVVIKEVAGGCLCCAAGVPMQVAINQIIQKAKPDRLLIEPTGLGHPAEILKVLTNEFNQQVLQLNQTLCVVDARKLKDTRYTENSNFNQQIDIAEVIYASKADLYQQDDFASLSAYLANDKKLCIASNTADVLNHVYWALIKPRAISLSSSSTQASYLAKSVTKPSQSLFDSNAAVVDDEFNGQGFITKLNQAQGAHSIGWIFSAEHCFDFDKLVAWCDGLLNEVLRIKAVMITEEGIGAFNAVDGRLSINELDEAMDSRLEIISLNPLSEALLTEQILNCLSDMA
ncbi:CobW family GTP-binding protein [Shewanella sp. 10N.286.48.B5]|uniref:CobW family GTP-binding protein n=1 Tax=Shewanella sp. 10N.286.48.B5 TaxID=1880834 RepID=UPI000C82705F|nr:GTP-binding protein [Shewanella sp. 10N.286.48.B5]PMH86001.1 hypothetical protein BCU57_12475 [Shewanella sp. 10N.286.48.B5]